MYLNVQIQAKRLVQDQAKRLQYVCVYIESASPQVSQISF